MGMGGMSTRGAAALALLVTLFLPSLARAARFDVIVNKNVEVDTLSKAELQSIFLSEKVKWNDRKYIKVAFLEEEGILKDFLQAIIGKTPAQFDTHWNRLVFTGKASMPPYFSDSAKIVEFVAGKPGAISFVPAGKAGSSVKVIHVK